MASTELHKCTGLLSTNIAGIYELPHPLDNAAVEISREYLDFTAQNHARRNLFSYLRYLAANGIGVKRVSGIDALMEYLVAHNTIRFDQPHEVGYTPVVKLQYYINFREAPEEDLILGAQVLAAMIRERMRKDNVSYTMIGAPSRDNPALAMFVGRHLGLPYLILGDGPIANESVAGRATSTDNVLLIGSVALTGATLRDTAELVRKAGAQATDAFVLVERVDAAREQLQTPSELLKHSGMTLHAARVYDDRFLERLCQK